MPIIENYLYLKKMIELLHKAIFVIANISKVLCTKDI
jgi:hypothetical protein